MDLWQYYEINLTGPDEHLQGIHWIWCFIEDFKIYSGLWPLSVSPRCQCVWQVKHQRFRRTGRVQKNHNILRKTTISNGTPCTHVFLFYKRGYRCHPTGNCCVPVIRWARRFWRFCHAGSGGEESAELLIVAAEYETLSPLFLRIRRKVWNTWLID